MDSAEGTDEIVEGLNGGEEQVIADVLDGWWPTIPLFADPIGAQWNQTPFGPDDVAIEKAGNRLLVQLRTDARPGNSPNNALLHIALADGSTLTAANAFPLHELPSAITEPFRWTLRFEFDHWSWLKEPPQAWLADAVGLWHSHSTGNLTARLRYSETEQELVLANLCFRGQTRSCLLRPSSGLRAYAWVVFSPNLGPWLMGDRVLLQWALGRRIGTNAFVGINAQADVVAIIHHPLRSGERGGQRALLPPQADDACAVNFFEKLCAAERADISLARAVQAYADGFDDTYDGEFLKVASALAMLTAADDAPDSSMLSQTAHQFSELVGQAFAKEGLQAESFLAPLNGIDPLRDAVRVFEHDLLAGFRLTEICRTALVAIVARRIGYDGPIAHTEIGIAGQESEIPDWWHPHMKAQKFPRYHVEAERPRSTIGWGRWPHFDVQVLSENRLVRGLAAFAAELQARAAHLVSATVAPYPTEAGARVYEFKVFVRSAPHVQAVMFTIREAAEGISIEGWSETPINISNYIRLKKFIAEVAGSERARTQIERFIAIGSSVRTSK